MTRDLYMNFTGEAKLQVFIAEHSSLNYPHHLAEAQNIPWDFGEDGAGFYSWKATCEIPQTIDIVPRAEDYGIISTIGELRVEQDGITKYVTLTEPQCSLNKVGFYTSKLENFRQDLKNALYDEFRNIDPELLEFAKFLESKGHNKPRTVEYIGVGKIRGIAAIAEKESSTFIFGSENLFKEAMAIARSRGLDGPEAIRFVKEYVIRHELAHIYGVDSEREVGLLLKEFYEKKAKNFKGTKREKYYKAIAAEARDYAEIFTGLHVSLNFENIEGLIAGYIEEAIEKGYSEKEAKDYVESRLTELTRSNSEKGSGRKTSRLEGKVEERMDKTTGESEHSEENAEAEAAEGGEEGSGEAAE